MKAQRLSEDLSGMLLLGEAETIEQFRAVCALYPMVFEVGDVRNGERREAKPTKPKPKASEGAK